MGTDPSADEWKCIAKERTQQRDEADRRWVAAEKVCEAAERVGDANFRKLEELLRRGGWITAADQVQAFRKVLEDRVSADWRKTKEGA